MKTSETIEKLAAALAKAQSDMKNAAFDSENPHFRSKYASLASVRDTITPALAKHELSLSQATAVRDDTFMLVTRLLHSSGQWLESEYPLPATTDKPQVMGSALTYARRYSASAITGIASDQDDDANAATTKRTEGEDEPVIGALNKTKLKTQLREFDTQLHACVDESELDGLLQSYGDILAQGRRDLPSWFVTKEGSDVLGLNDRIDAAKTKLAEIDPDNRATYAD